MPFSLLHAEEESAHDVARGKKIKRRRVVLSEREQVASHSILLSTVQYLYVHPIVLTWVASPEKRENKKKKILTLKRMISVQRDVSPFQ